MRKPHVAFHEAGHVVVLKAALGRSPPRRRIDLEQPEPAGWSEFTRSLLEASDPAFATRVTAFLFGGVEALSLAIDKGRLRAHRHHGMNAPDGADGDAELIDLAVIRFGADPWTASDLARDLVAREWQTIEAVAELIQAAGEIDPQATETVLARVQSGPSG